MEDIEQLVRELRAVTGRHYPAELRRRVGAYIARQRAANVTWRAIHRELGLANQTIRRWAESSSVTAKFRPITTPSNMNSKPVNLVSPQGWRLENLDANIAAEIFRDLAR